MSVCQWLATGQWFSPGTPVSSTNKTDCHDYIPTTYIFTYCVNQYHYESLWVVMWLVHATGKTWYKVLYQHTMYVISLSNISIKTNFKQITKIVLKLTYKKCICTIPWVWLHFVHDVTSFVTVHSPMCGCCSITFSVTVQSSYYALFIWRDVEWKYWKYVLENDNMTVNSQYII